MAGIDDPFTPGPTADPTAGLPNASLYDNLVNQWTQFLNDPRGRGALLQGGISLMQPRGFGDTASGQMGRAVGSAGEAVGRAEAADIRQQEANSKDELRTAQAGSAESRARTAEAQAGTAGARADAASTRLAFQQSESERKVSQNRTQNILRAQALYRNEMRDWDRTHDPLTNPVPRGQTPPVRPSYEQWLNGRPQLRDSITTGSPLAESPAAQSTTPLPGLRDVRSVPRAQLTAGEVYNTASGPMEWTGTGFRVPGGRNDLE